MTDFSEHLKSFYQKMFNGKQKNFFLVDEYLNKKQKEACKNFEKFFKLELKSLGNIYWKEMTSSWFGDYTIAVDTYPEDLYEKIYEKYYERACEEFKQDSEAFQENCPNLENVINKNKPRYFEKLKNCMESQKDFLYKIWEVEKEDARNKSDADENLEKISESLEKLKDCYERSK